MPKPGGEASRTKPIWRRAPTISIHVARAAFAEAIARGQEPAALCARFGITPEELGDPDGRISVDAMTRIWNELPPLIGTNDLGIAMARRAQAIGALSVVGYVLRAAPTVGDGVRAVLRFQRLITDATISHFAVAGDEATITFVGRDPTFVLSRHAIEFVVAAVMFFARDATGTEISPARLAFCHPRPADDSETRRVFGCPIEYDAPAHVVTARAVDLALPLRSADPHLAAVLERHAAALEAQLPPATSFTARFREQLRLGLGSGEIELAHVAAKLRVSARTAQRRLHEEGTTHKRVLDDLRRGLALRYLGDDELNIQQVAFLLGFCDQSAFHHAFVRWTGASPGAHRKARRPGTG